MKIYVNAGHSLSESGANTSSHKENLMAIDLRDRVLHELYKIEDTQIIIVPDKLTLRQSIAWVNETATPDDIAFSIHFNSHRDAIVSGTEAYYSNDREEEMAIVFAEEVSKAGGFVNRGARHDRLTWVGSLGWLRKLKCDSVLVEVCYLTNPTDMRGYDPHKVARGFAEAVRVFNKIKPDLPTVESLKKRITFLQKIVALLARILELTIKLKQ